MAALLAAAPVMVAQSPGAAVAPTACQQAPAPGVPIPPLAPRDPLIGALGLDQAWALSTGEHVTVGVVDTGVDPASPKLAGAVQYGQTYRPVASKAVYTHAADGRVDCDGHGTEIAAIIAGRTNAGDDRVSGIAPSAAIYPVAIQGDIAQAPTALIGAAIRDAADHASVINLSFAQTTDSQDIRTAIEYALSKDVVVVAAAANETGTVAAGGSATWYPAAYPGVLAVASVSADGSSPASAARGTWIGLAAPGDSLTTVTRGGKGYVTVSGTSFATAVVAGAAALLRARAPNLTAREVVARLEETAVPPGDGSHDDAIGYGIVDPYAALTNTAVSASASGRTRAGAVAVQRVREAGKRGSSAEVLGATAMLVALAVLVGLATITVRSGRRRGWHAGRTPGTPGTPVDDRTAEPHPAELG
jgi:type VII secretion-associated serine protease mycosin